MAKQVTHAVEFEAPSIRSFGPSKRRLVVRTDDDSIYEFSKFEDAPHFALDARGSVDEPRQKWSQSKAQLPGDVERTLDSLKGLDGWKK